MKRKTTVAFLAMASALLFSANADSYETLIFKTVSGESYAVKAKELEIYCKDGKITFNNDQRSIDIPSLVSMEFSNDAADNSGVTGILSESSGSVTVYSVDGIKTGEFVSLSEAYECLKPGLYIVRPSNGDTFKIKVEK